MLNPIAYTEKVIGDFLRYQLTTYPFADSNLYAQMRTLLNLEETRATPLLKGPYISLSRTFRTGPELADLAAEGILHPQIANIAAYPSAFGHQESAYRAIAAGKTTLVSTGTGSGKTECFLYPVISRCFKRRDEGADPGIIAVIVYPMNALAEDQLGRMRELLAGTGITFGMYVGKTPERQADISGVRLPAGSSKADYMAALAQARQNRETRAIHPPEEIVSREEMRTAGKQPRILLTNVKQLELLLTRQKDVELFDNARLEFMVFDEAHTFKGANGAETACLIRRLRTFCGKDAADTTCIATSATIADPERGPEAGRDFASRFFGVDPTNVAIVSEEYEPDLWADKRKLPGPLPGAPGVHLKNVLDALDNNDQSGLILKTIYQAMTGDGLDADRWEESLYERMAANELVYQIVESLRTPRSMSDLVEDLAERIGRPTSEEEVLAWLALGAASRKGGRPLLRPVVHAFVRGVGGAVVTFPDGQSRPKLYLSAEDAVSDSSGTLPQNGQGEPFRLPITTCTTCGQHYFQHHAADFTFCNARPEGGQAIGDAVVWRSLDPTRGGKRLLLVDRLIGGDETDDDSDSTTTTNDGLARSTVPIYFCRYCGALHAAESERCLACGHAGELLKLHTVRQRDSAPGMLSACIACKTQGRPRAGGFREPARPVRAVTVSDVHVLAQNLIQHAERRRLLVFADNRQDAAFQAGWMQDHARRFRLRSLMYERISQGSVSIGDLTAYLDQLLEEDDDLSQTIAPEVWRVHRKEAEGVHHRQERKQFLRIQVLREVTTGVKQRIGLEPWGRMVIEYGGLTPDLPFVTNWAPRLGVSPEELVNGIAALLDINRRANLLLDREAGIFSKFWQEGALEIQRGYLPLLQGVPKGLKLRRQPTDDSGRVQAWLSDRGQTVPRQAAGRWGVPREQIDDFIEELWRTLVGEVGLLGPVTLLGNRNRALPNCAGVYQIDADRLRLAPHTGVYRCNTCRRASLRATPHMVCLTWHCTGTLTFEPESRDDYDLTQLDQGFAMLRAREHSAQVPASQREELERAFKDDHELVNTLVCTPTLEMGVDIGSLDAVLMRNVPPLPANYWQRAGRAGRRHRMAVNLTYARPASHDRAYFIDPLKLLQGIIYPPRFNLRNELMIQKHVHATVLTVLQRLARTRHELAESDRHEIGVMLAHCFPAQVKDYLFDNAGHVRSAPLDTSMLSTVVSKHEAAVLKHLGRVFGQGWPAEDRFVVTDESLRGYVDRMHEQLNEVVVRVWRRLQWALDQMRRLDDLRRLKGTLDPDEDSLWNRCDRLVKKYKGMQARRRREGEGFDDTNTYSVLATEGFLPGYGLDTGSVLGTAQVPRHIIGLMDFELPRPSGVALREYIPGNLIYANGNRFVPRFFHLEPVPPTLFQVDLTNEAIAEVGTARPGLAASFGASFLQAVPICDVDLTHQSHITDEEDYRFQMPVTTIGQEQDRHAGGKAFSWGAKNLLIRNNVYLRIVNVGPTSLVRSQGQLGYQICLVCGQSRSPFASQAELLKFAQDHRERCGQQVQGTGFFADVIADALSIQDCLNKEEAYSITEALRMGASQVLDMEIDDLQVLAIAQPGSEQVDILLYDPMPGGSGLLEQMIDRWEEVVAAAIALVDECPSDCGTACVDCLLTFRNAHYHRYLNRQLVAERLRAWGSTLNFSFEVPPKLANVGSDEQPVNVAETTLRDMLRRAGFPDPMPQHQIDLGRPLGTTTPDFFYDDPTDRADGICLYLDGMSNHLHGKPETQQRDRTIREELRNQNYEVFEITATELGDRQAMARHFYRLGRIMLGREQATMLRDTPDSWHSVTT